MATIIKQALINAPAETVWSALRDVGALHTRLCPGFVVDTRMDGDARIVTFGNGMTARERIINVDEAARRLAYSASGGPSVPAGYLAAGESVIVTDVIYDYRPTFGFFLPDTIRMTRHAYVRPRLSAKVERNND